MSSFARTLALALLSLTAAPAMAEGFKPVTAKSEFVDLIDGRQLTRLGIRLTVSPAGGIQGRAFGQDVRGAWRWQGNFFCRDLAYGDTELGPNCQQVLVKGDTVRFVADQGKGQSADLRLR
jgi:hypothetical protein